MCYLAIQMDLFLLIKVWFVFCYCHCSFECLAEQSSWMSFNIVLLWDFYRTYILVKTQCLNSNLKTFMLFYNFLLISSNQLFSCHILCCLNLLKLFKSYFLLKKIKLIFSAYKVWGKLGNLKLFPFSYYQKRSRHLTYISSHFIFQDAIERKVLQVNLSN